MDKKLYKTCVTDCKGKIIKIKHNGEEKFKIEAIIPVINPFSYGDDVDFYLLAKPG